MVSQKNNNVFGGYRSGGLVNKGRLSMPPGKLNISQVKMWEGLENFL